MAMPSLAAKQSLEQATARYQAHVNQAGAYLASRGITPEVAATVRLGYVDPDDHEPGHEQYVGRLTIPFITPIGGVIDIRFRSIITDDGPKYLTRPGGDSHLYNVVAFQQESDVIAICEGEIDTITAHYLCGIPAVGISGANNWKDWYARAFYDYRRVIVLCDGDQPGRDLGKRIASQLDTAVVVSMPDNHDVNSLFVSDGPTAVRERAGL